MAGYPRRFGSVESAWYTKVARWSRVQAKLIDPPIYSVSNLVGVEREKSREGQKCQRWSLPMKDVENVWYGEPVERG